MTGPRVPFLLSPLDKQHFGSLVGISYDNSNRCLTCGRLRRHNRWGVVCELLTNLG